MADYGIVLLSHVSSTRGSDRPRTARDLSEVSLLPYPTVSKILKSLSRAGLLVAHRGKQGGYTLARDPKTISVVEMIAAVDGPIALTECGSSAPNLCDIESSCPVRSNWQRITSTVRKALEGLTLADMTPPVSACSDQGPQITQLRGGRILELVPSK